MSHGVAVEQTEDANVARRYVLLGEIARGGMGVVHEVRDRATSTRLALKRIRLDARAERDVLLASFEREYQVLAGLDHPGIIRVFDYGIDDGQPYYTMELVEGQDLRDLAPIPWRRACQIMRDVASALSLIHARRLIHRDLSPGNVKVAPDGRAKLLDFGALTDFGYARWIVGTPPLVAPEAIAFGLLDQRVDLYALGALGYWLITGHHAYEVGCIDELEAAWRRVPPPPSSSDGGIPHTLDALLMSLLSLNPLARPGSAAEVIANLNGIAELAPESEAERRRLALSFLAAPPFVGRDGQILAIRRCLAEMIEGRGHAITVRGAPGSGRSRLLEEASVRAQLAGATVLRVDAIVHPSSHGTSRALVTRAFEALPELAARLAPRHRGALVALGKDVLMLLGDAHAPSVSKGSRADAELAAFFLDISSSKPLVIQVDNAEYADHVSLGLLATLAREASTHCLLLQVNERSDLVDAAPRGLRALRELSTPLSLPPLAASESFTLVRSMFGDAPNLARFAEWLHALTAGNPLLTVELSRQLVEQGELRYEGGMWRLPSSRPMTIRSAVLDEVLSLRIGRLSPAALDLARCLGVAQVPADPAFCAILGGEHDERGVGAQLDELTRCDVMRAEQGTYHFSSVALRQVLLADMPEHERRASHLRVGHALLALAATEPVPRIEAGWHFIRAGHDLQGAELIDGVVKDSLVAGQLTANMYRIGAPVAAALEVFRRHLRPPHAQLPLLSALSTAGIFEDHRYAARYADEALELLSEFSGMRLARRLRFLGRTVALCVALCVASLRWRFSIPDAERPYSFRRVLVSLFGTVVSSVCLAAVKLDGDRAHRVADVLEPFSGLPSRLTAPTIYRFCHGLQQMAREHPVEASRTFDDFVTSFDDSRSLRMVPKQMRMMFVCAAHLARGAFAVFRDDGTAALESARVLDESGLRLYAMIGSQLRYLYHLNRDETTDAAQHRTHVELHAAHFGSAWQVDFWEAPALLPLQLTFEDPTSVASLAHQLEVTSREVPSLRRYAHLSWVAVQLLSREALQQLLERERSTFELEASVPRSFIGWSLTVATIARGYNLAGAHELAYAWCERALSQMNDADREYVGLFLPVDLQAALAEAGLGRGDAALHRLDALIERFRGSTNPLTLGRLHEARARIAWKMNHALAFERSLAEVERWFGHSNTPGLVAKYERLLALREPGVALGPRPPANSNGALLESELSRADTVLTKRRT